MGIRTLHSDACDNGGIIADSILRKECGMDSRQNQTENMECTAVCGIVPMVCAYVF